MQILDIIKKNLSFEKHRGRWGFVGRTQNTIISAAFILFLSSGMSAALGLVKGRLLTNYFGVTDTLGIFYTADKIPNLIYSILVVGALSTVFIPVFTEQIKKDKDLAWETASSIIIVGFLFFAVLSFIAMLFAPQLINLIALGQFSPEEVALGANLMRLMLVAQIVLVVSSFVTSILQSFKIFTYPALAPVVYNLGMIFGVITLSNRFGIYGPAYGVIIGALLHFLIQLPALRGVEFNFKIVLRFKNKGIQNILKLMPPRILSVVLNQIVSTISNSLAILVSTSSVVILKFASQLQFFPVHLFGASMAAAALPILSEQSAEGNQVKFKKIFVTTLHQMLFLVMPTSMLLLILRVPIVRLVYGTSNFPWEATVKTSYALAFFSLSIFAQSIVYLCTRAFYAKKDTLTPVKVSATALVISTSLAILSIKEAGLGVWAISAAFSFATMVEASLMIYLLGKKLGGFSFEELAVPFIKISFATLFMGMFLYVPLKILDTLVFDTTRTINLIFLTGIVVSAGMASYLVFTKTLKVEEIELFYKLLRKFKLKTSKDTVPATVVSDTSEN